MSHKLTLKMDIFRKNVAVKGDMFRYVFFPLRFFLIYKELVQLVWFVDAYCCKGWLTANNSVISQVAPFFRFTDQVIVRISYVAMTKVNLYS